MKNDEQVGTMVEYKTQSGEPLKLTMQFVRDFLVSGKKELVTAKEIIYFMGTCKARKLNPLIKDCYLVKYDNSPAAIITSVDYFRKNAKLSADCRGWNAGIVVLKKDSTEPDYREGTLLLPTEELVGGWAEALPHEWVKPKKHTVNLDTYIQRKKDGTITSFWKEPKQPDMIMKVAECQLLRQIWGEESTGMYAPEEMPSLEDIGGSLMDMELPGKKADRLKTKAKTSQEKTGADEPEHKKALLDPDDNLELQKLSDGQNETDKNQQSGLTLPDKKDHAGDRGRDTSGKFVKKDEQKTGDPPPVEKKKEYVNPFDNYDGFKNFRKETDGLSTYYYKNRDKWADAELENKLKFISKWRACYRKVDLPGPLAEFDPESPENKEQTKIIDKGEDAGSDAKMGEATGAFHDPEFIEMIPTALKTIYEQLANVTGCLLEEVNPSLVNSTLKSKYKAHWDKAREDLGFAPIVSTPEAYDTWNEKIITIVEGRDDIGF